MSHRHDSASGLADDAYWQVPTTDYVSAAPPESRGVFADRKQLDDAWRNAIARFRPHLAPHPAPTPKD